jgi:hypothetical protein
VRVFWLVVLAACSAEIRPLPTRGLEVPAGVTVIHDPGTWQAFIARQPAEPALRLRALEIDFARESFVLARLPEPARFAAPRVRDGVVVIEARPDAGGTLAFAALVREPAVRARLVVSGP